MERFTFILVLAVIVFVSGFGSTHSEMELIEGGGTEESSGDCGTILKTLQMSQNQLDKLDDTVRSITPHLKDNIELGFFKLLEKIEHFIERKFDELDKNMNNKFQETKTYIDSKLTVIENKISEYSSHIDSKITGFESTITHALNVSDTLNNNNACCQASVETAAFMRNTSTKINDMDMRTLNMSAKLHEMIHKLTDLVVPTIENNISRLDGLLNSTTELVRYVPDIITTTEVNKQAPKKCESSQQEECCTAAVVDYGKYTVYTEISAGRHTVVNMTSAGLQEYTMYFAVRGEYMLLLLSPTSPYFDLLYQIGFGDIRGGHISMYAYLPTVYRKTVYDIDKTNIISREKYSYYYVRISGDTLEVGRRGEPPLMIHTNTELKRFKYFSFASLGSTRGAALYDCTAE